MKGLTTFRKAALAAAAVLGMVGAFSATAQAQTIEKAKQAGVIRIGVMGEQAPWGSFDSAGQNIGYDVDVGRLIGQELGVKVEFVPNVVSARIPNLLTGKVDLQMAVMGMYPDRAKAVQFSEPYAGLKIILIASKKHKIEKIEDARNLRIGVPRGAAQDKAITALLGDSPNIRRFDDDSSNMQALVSGQVDAIGGNTTYKINLDKANGQRLRAEARVQRAVDGHLLPAGRPEDERVAQLLYREDQGRRAARSHQQEVAERLHARVPEVAGRRALHRHEVTIPGSC